MITSKTRARLMELIKINKDYPYYGGLVFTDKSVFPKGNILPKSNEVWVYQEVLDQLNLKLEDKLKIGQASFVIKKNHTN